MTDKPRDKRMGGGWAVALVVALVLLPVVYVPSCGPVGRVTEYPTWSRLYAPLEWVADQWDPARRSLSWYMVECGAWQAIGDDVYYLPPH